MKWLLALTVLAATQRAAAATLTRGPYLQLRTTHSVTVIWDMDAPARCGLALHSPDGSTTVLGGGTAAVCEIRVESLSPGRSYGYAPLADNVPLRAESVFRTDDPRVPFDFLVVGDTGSGSPNQNAVRDLMLATPADFLLHVGDVVYDFGFDTEFFVPYRDLLPRLPLWATVGNHDVSAAGGVPWSGFFITPANNPAGVPNYYSFDAGNAHFAVIDSNQSTSPGSPQYTFLDNDLAASTALWKFVAFHHSIYSSGTVHGSNLPVRANLVPLLDKHAVDLVFMGHEHNYERTKPLRANQVVAPGTGTVYVTSGGGGHDLYPLRSSSFTAYAESAFEITRVAIDRGTLQLQMIRADGAVRDSLTLVKTPPPGCGDGVVNQPGEQCDGADAAACPGLCGFDCRCAPPPRCGDGVRNQPGEQCDGADALACPGACRADCTCAARCGDEILNQPGEQCDGRADAACPGRCLPNCGCADPPVALDLGPVADTSIVGGKQATWDHGAAGDLDVGLKPLPAMTYLKFDLSNVRTKIAKAILTLTCIHPSTDGGTVYPVASSSWPEGNRPGLDSTSAKGPGLKWKDVDTNRNGQIDPRDTSPYVPDFTRPLASLGPVLPGRSYSVDVTGALASGAGSYTLVISSLKSTPGSYASRENGTAQGPLLHLVVAPSPRCGDNRVNQATEQCDGAASAACPGRCRADCTCQPLPRCGDGTLNQPSEVCDGADDSACPGRCRVDCTCAPPRCGDNLVDQAGEECDGTTSPACPGRCRTDCTCAPARCGDDLVDQPREQCDGTADSACPGRCRVDCTCAPAPSCGDNLVNQPGEQCDGSSSAACPGRCRRDCTCAPLPRCGDNVVNQVSEQCDGTDGGACPGLCQPDCTCGPPVAVVEADASVSAATTTTNYGKSTVLEVDASPLNRAFLRVRVNGVGDRHVAAARLRLVVGKGSSASSDSGGRLHAITSCGWNELSMTWKTQPAIDGPLLGQAGPVLLSQAVDFDLTSAIGGDGVHCFALDTPSLNNVEYNSKEAAVGKPQVLLTVLPPVVPFCGDGRANQPSEQCDGTADSACPGRCRVDCTCASPPVCGDNRVDQAREQCDGTADSACPGRCRADCTCAPLPGCGDNVVNCSNEQCDGTDDHACPGRCRTDCTCAPPPTCGDNVVNQASEQCDGTADSACPGRCRSDCTCGPAPVCGDNVVNQASEQCDGTADSACPGRCRSNCTCAPAPVCGDNVVNQASEQCDGTADSACPGRCRADCTCAPAPVCGDNAVNQASEECDGTADSACPGRCRADCTCTPAPVCGDNVVNQASEHCDGTADSACPSRCRADCTCAPLPVCGDNVVNQANESCDGADDSACPGRCQSDCTCAPPPTCGDNVVNQATESCDGTDDSACPARCRADCTCAPAPVCGDNVVNQANESCDGADDSACPGRCQSDCTCAPPPTCGDDVVNQATESCDGTDDSTCPGRCRPDCTCAPLPVCGDSVVNQANESCDGADDSACPGRCQADCTCAPPPTCGDNVVNQAAESCDGTDDSACPGACAADCTCGAVGGPAPGG